MLSCVICGKKFRNLQAIRAHHRSHRDRLVRASFLTDHQLWDQFKLYCESKGETTCHLLNSLIKSCLNLKDPSSAEFPQPSSNPNSGNTPTTPPVAPQVNLYQFFLGYPGSRSKLELDQITGYKLASKVLAQLSSRISQELVDCPHAIYFGKKYAIRYCTRDPGYYKLCYYSHTNYQECSHYRAIQEQSTHG